MRVEPINLRAHVLGVTPLPPGPGPLQSAAHNPGRVINSIVYVSHRYSGIQSPLRPTRILNGTGIPGLITDTAQR